MFIIFVVVDVVSSSIPIIAPKVAPASIVPSISIAPRLAVKQEDDYHHPGATGIGIHTTKEWIVPPRPKVCPRSRSVILVYSTNHFFL